MDHIRFQIQGMSQIGDGFRKKGKAFAPSQILKWIKPKAMTAINTTKSLTISLAVIAMAGISLAWIGGRTLDHTLSEVTQNTEFRITQTSKMERVEEYLSDIKVLMQRQGEAITEVKEGQIRMEGKIEQWESIEQK